MLRTQIIEVEPNPNRIELTMFCSNPNQTKLHKKPKELKIYTKDSGKKLLYILKIEQTKFYLLILFWFF